MVKSNPSIFISNLKSEHSCKDFIIQKRWPNGIECPFDKCNSKFIYVTNRGYKCAKCLKKFSYKTGTLLENSRLSAMIWLKAISYVAHNKINITSVALSKHLKISQRSAWLLINKLKPEIHDPVYSSQQYFTKRGMHEHAELASDAFQQTSNIYQNKLCVNSDVESILAHLLLKRKIKRVYAKLLLNNDFMQTMECVIDEVKGKTHVVISIPEKLRAKGLNFNDYPIDINLFRWGDYDCNCNLRTMDYFNNTKTPLFEIKFYKPKQINRIGFYILPIGEMDIKELEFFVY